MQCQHLISLVIAGPQVTTMNNDSVTRYIYHEQHLEMSSIISRFPFKLVDYTHNPKKAYAYKGR